MSSPSVQSRRRSSRTIKESRSRPVAGGERGGRPRAGEGRKTKSRSRSSRGTGGSTGGSNSNSNSNSNSRSSPTASPRPVAAAVTASPATAAAAAAAAAAGAPSNARSRRTNNGDRDQNRGGGSRRGANAKDHSKSKPKKKLTAQEKAALKRHQEELQREAEEKAAWNALTTEQQISRMAWKEDDCLEVGDYYGEARQRNAKLALRGRRLRLGFAINAPEQPERTEEEQAALVASVKKNGVVPFCVYPDPEDKYSGNTGLPETDPDALSEYTFYSFGKGSEVHGPEPFAVVLSGMSVRMFSHYDLAKVKQENASAVQQEEEIFKRQFMSQEELRRPSKQKKFFYREYQSMAFSLGFSLRDISEIMIDSNTESVFILTLSFGYKALFLCSQRNHFLHRVFSRLATQNLFVLRDEDHSMPRLTHRLTTPNFSMKAARARKAERAERAETERKRKIAAKRRAQLKTQNALKSMFGSQVLKNPFALAGSAPDDQESENVSNAANQANQAEGGGGGNAGDLEEDEEKVEPTLSPMMKYNALKWAARAVKSLADRKARALPDHVKQTLNVSFPDMKKGQLSMLKKVQMKNLMRSQEKMNQLEQETLELQKRHEEIQQKAGLSLKLAQKLKSKAESAKKQVVSAELGGIASQKLGKWAAKAKAKVHQAHIETELDPITGNMKGKLSKWAGRAARKQAGAMRPEDEIKNEWRRVQMAEAAVEARQNLRPVERSVLLMTKELNEWGVRNRAKLDMLHEKLRRSMLTPEERAKELMVKWVKEWKAKRAKARYNMGVRCILRKIRRWKTQRNLKMARVNRMLTRWVVRWKAKKERAEDAAMRVFFTRYVRRWKRKKFLQQRAAAANLRNFLLAFVSPT